MILVVVFIVLELIIGFLVGDGWFVLFMVDVGWWVREVVGFFKVDFGMFDVVFEVLVDVVILEMIWRGLILRFLFGNLVVVDVIEEEVMGFVMKLELVVVILVL